MDWAFIIKGVAYTYLFLACLALYVHLHIRKTGGNRGKALLQVVVTAYATGIIISVVGGAILYLLRYVVGL
ncbi:MAG: hypothetical protein PHU69_08365 [Fermentimonas sp.]|nr:hypothetical protein [Fermentimonas sp.]